MKPKKNKPSEKSPEEGSDKSGGEDQDDFAQFIANAIRAPREGIYEHLLSQFLAQAVIVTDPLKRIKIVCEAALMVPEKDREDLAIDYDKINVLNQVANALLNATPGSQKDWQIDYISVPWPFFAIEENYDKFIRPWLNSSFEYWPVLMTEHCKWHWKHTSSYPFRVLVIDEIVSNPIWSWFFDASHYLTPTGFNTIKGVFGTWAMPQVQLYLTELTSAVSPTLYAEILGLARGKKKGYAQKMEETTEAVEAPKESET